MSVSHFCLLNHKPQTKCQPPVSLGSSVFVICRDVWGIGLQMCVCGGSGGGRMTAVGMNTFATFGLDVQVLGLVGKYLSGRRVVFPRKLHTKLDSVLLREGSF